MIKPFSKGLRESRGEQPLAATAVAESLRRTPSRRPTDNAKRSAGRGEKTVRWTVFSRGDPRRGSPRRGATGASHTERGYGGNLVKGFPQFAEQGEAKKGCFHIKRRAKIPGFFDCLTPCPLSLAEGEGVPPRHPAVHLAANGATPPLKGRGVFPKVSCRIEARKALSVRRLPVC